MKNETKKTMPVLTVRQPWAGALVLGWKPVENRDWIPPAWLQVGNRYAIHSSKNVSRIDFIDDLKTIASLMRCDAMNLLDNNPLLNVHGSIIGSVQHRGVVSATYEAWDRWGIEIDGWFFGAYGWCVEKAAFLGEPVPAKGALGLWQAPLIPELMASI